MGEEAEDMILQEWGSWGLVDEFIKKERDATRSSVTHVRVAFATVTIVSILLSLSGFFKTLAKISELKNERIDSGEALFVFALAITMVLILAAIAYALWKIRRSLVANLEEELRCKAKVILSTSKEFKVAIPPATTELLESMQKL